MLCTKCKYEWNTKSTKMYVSCPNCLSKVRRVAKEIPETIIKKLSIENYNKYISEFNIDDVDYDGNPIPIPTYNEWKKTVLD